MGFAECVYRKYEDLRKVSVEVVARVKGGLVEIRSGRDCKGNIYRVLLVIVVVLIFFKVNEIDGYEMIIFVL